MSEHLARAEAARLKTVMARHGVVCSIELQPGRPNRTGWGDDWFTRKVALVQHHTAGARTGNTPSLALVKRGRSDLPGPLCNGYGGRDHVYRVLTLGLANHPGAGGPITVPRVGGGSYRIPKDSARHLTWGTEWEHDGVSPWPAAMQEFMGRAGAALSEWLELPRGTSLEHRTWAPGRKVDRNGYTAASGDAEIERWRAAGVPAPARPAPARPTPAQAAHAAAVAATPVNQEESADMRVVIENGRWWLVGAAPLPVYIPTTVIGQDWADALGQKTIPTIGHNTLAILMSNTTAVDIADIRQTVHDVAGRALTAEQVDQIVDTSLRDFSQVPATVDHAGT